MPVPATVAPEADALLRAAIALLREDDLSDIAACDQGQDVDGNLAALRGIVAAGTADMSLIGPACEGLALTRWPEPDRDRPEDPAGGRRQRLFACAALLRALGASPGHAALDGGNQTVMGLIGSLPGLEPGLEREAAGFLAWLLPRLPPREAQEHPFFGLAQLWLLLALEIDDPVLVALADWILLAEARLPKLDGFRLAPAYRGRWLLDATVFQLCHAQWEALGAALPGRLRPRHGAAVRERVERIGALLAG